MHSRVDPVQRVTLQAIAAEAGVSVAAASLALRGKPGVGELTRQRVHAVAAELGYRNRSSTPTTASALTIGLLVKSRPLDLGTTNAFYASVIAGISEACAGAGIDLRLDTLLVDEHFNPVETPRLLESGDIHGVLVLGAYLSAQSATMLGSRPVVLVDGYSSDPDQFPSVVTDNHGGVIAATEKFIALGHQRIALVGTTPDAFPSILERRRGYEVAMAAAGLDTIYIDGPHDDPVTSTARTLAALRRRPGITGLVCANDMVALSLVDELRSRIPATISVVGFDDIDAASLIRPRLDTVAVDKMAMGRLAVSLLRHRIANPEDPAFAAVQRAHLIVRESSGPPGRR